MDTAQRRGLRRTLTERGFTRTGYTDDISGVGDYAETFTHTDGTTIEVKWAPREVPAPVAAPEDRTLTESRTAGWDGTVIPPEAFARFLNKPVRISIAHKDGTGETREGVVRDVWRFDSTSLGIRLSDTPSADQTGMVLPDDAVWRVELTGVPQGTDEHWNPAHLGCDVMGAPTPSWRDHLNDALAARQSDIRLGDASGSITPEVLASVDAQVRAIVSTPGMYEETDHGIRLTLPVSDEEDRITSGAPAPTGDLDASEHPHPSLVAKFEGKQTTFTVTAEKGDDNGRTESTGYPVDAWRFSPTALAVRVALDKPTTPYSYGVRALDGTDYIVLPDNREWSATSTDGTTLSHIVHDHWY